MIKGMALGNKGNKLSLALGLILGLLAAVLVAVYLSSAGSDGGTSTTSAGPTVPVVVAAKDIGSGTRITSDMVTVRDVSQDSVLTGAFDKPESVVDQITTVPIVSGEQVISAKVVGTGADLSEFGDNPPLALIVSQGMRGVSVEVNSIVGAGGLVRPGDYVDVVLTVRVKAGEGNDQIAATVLQNLKVLAVGQTVATTGLGTEDPAKQKDNDKDATTVTLAATPIQGEVLALADACRLNFEGRLAIAVRAFGDSGGVSSRTEWPADGAPPNCASLFGLQSLP